MTLKLSFHLTELRNSCARLQRLLVLQVLFCPLNWDLGPFAVLLHFLDDL